MENKLIHNNKCEFNNDIAKKIIEGVLDKIIITDEDKEFLSRPFTIESFYNDIYDIDIVVNNIVQCINWRNTEMKQGFIEYDSKNNISSLILDNDLDGYPTIYINSCHSHDDFKYCIYTGAYLVEKILKVRKNTKYNIIIDCYKCKSSHYLDIMNMKYFIKILKIYYPFRINKCLLINANQIAYNIINMVKPLVSDYMKNRIFAIKNPCIELSNMFTPKTILFFKTIKESIDESPKEILDRLSK